jgi:hypothetical protein
VHPLEQLRYVARGWATGDDFPAQEVAGVLAELAAERPATLLQACRRLIEYFPGSGPVWWLSSRALSAPEPVEGIWDAADELAQDPTGRLLAESLPGNVAVAVLRPSRAVAHHLGRRRDLVLTKKAGNADIVVVSAAAAGPATPAGPASLLVSAAAATAAATAGRSGKAVWAVAEWGVVLPGPLWEQLLGRMPAEAATTLLPASAVKAGVGDRGRVAASELLATATCPPIAELLGWSS